MEEKKPRNWSNCQRFGKCTDPRKTIVTYCDVACQLFEPKPDEVATVLCPCVEGKPCPIHPKPDESRLPSSEDILEWRKQNPLRTPVETALWVRDLTASIVRAEVLKEVENKIFYISLEIPDGTPVLHLRNNGRVLAERWEALKQMPDEVTRNTAADLEPGME